MNEETVDKIIKDAIDVYASAELKMPCITNLEALKTDILKVKPLDGLVGDVCEWASIALSPLGDLYLTNCGVKMNIDTDYIYCPNCGKKINEQTA